MTCKDKQKLPDYVVQNWKLLNPDLEIKLYDNKECIRFLTEKFSSEYATIFKKIQHGPYKADFWRLCVLYYYGGYYSDIDMYPLKSLKYIVHFWQNFFTNVFRSKEKSKFWQHLPLFSHIAK